ncbi:alpha-isopropylmalate synthase regulatory domain-containing protein [Natronospora cellulosivora (SeqCode)]
MKVEIMDTTLRDGEQTSGVSFTAIEKLSIAKFLLKEVKVDRIEIASARVSQGELASVKEITKWAKEHKILDQIEVLGFIDGNKSLDWIYEAGARVVNMLCKGSLKHVEIQLKKTAEQHLSDLKQSIAYAKELGIDVNLYLEDWSNGMIDSPQYVINLIEGLKNEGIKRFMLPDTLGVLSPVETERFCKEMVNKFPGLKFDFHAHNDYGLAAANSLAAINAGVNGLHTTVNGLGERTGNTDLAEIVVCINDHLKGKTSVEESKLYEISDLVERFSGERIAANAPIVGDNVFTQVCGVHADGDNKGDLYHNKLLPERFGRIRKYALGKTSGKASIKNNLDLLGIELDKDSLRKVTERVIELGDKKKNITIEDLPYIVSDVLEDNLIEENVKLNNYYISYAHGLKPVATLSIDIYDEQYEASANGDGQYDAFMNAITQIYSSIERELPALMDYNVSIPPGGHTNALVETVITWSYLDKEFKTKALNPDQTTAAIEATIKMLNYIENYF